MRASWSERWMGLLEDAGGQAPRRLEQGRTLVRAGRVTDLRVGPGWLTGKVQGSRATPFAVELTAEPLDDAAWQTAVRCIAGEVGHVARLLAGHAPDGLLDDLEAVGVRLLPPLEALDQTCPCGERTVPCAHAAGLWAAVGERLDDDPFLLLHLRGRGRERLLQEVAAARRPPGPEQRTGVALDAVDPAGWRRARGRLEDLRVPVGTPPAVPAAPLRVLGDPPGWEGRVDAWALLSPLVEAAASRASGRGRDGEDR